MASTVDDGLKQLQKVIFLMTSVYIYSSGHVLTKCLSGIACESPQAERTQRQGGMVMCASVLVILCFIMLVLLILKEILL